jgi:hypothetical protein
METKFRPIQVTILDILAVLLPGFAWLILLTTTFRMFERGVTSETGSPLDAWRKLAEFTRGEDAWFASISLIIAALVIGYALKPLSMSLVQLITTWLLMLQYRDMKFSDLRFPYNGIYRRKQCYAEVQKLIKSWTSCTADQFHGTQPFSATKRYLRLVAPALWEESERMEAEVRMIGAMFLTSVYSIALSAVSLLQHREVTAGAGRTLAVIWLTLSLIGAAVLALSFNKSRVREVGFTYMNALIARGHKPVQDRTSDLECDD